MIRGDGCQIIETLSIALETRYSGTGMSYVKGPTRSLTLSCMTAHMILKAINRGGV